MNILNRTKPARSPAPAEPELSLARRALADAFREIVEAGEASPPPPISPERATPKRHFSNFDEAKAAQATAEEAERQERARRVARDERLNEALARLRPLRLAVVEEHAIALIAEFLAARDRSLVLEAEIEAIVEFFQGEEPVGHVVRIRNAMDRPFPKLTEPWRARVRWIDLYRRLGEDPVAKP